MRAIALSACLAAFAAFAQAPHDPAALLAAQREAMKAFAFLDGAWRGTAWSLQPGGVRHELVQTERIGPFLDGAVKVIEGRGYRADGSVGFNALGILSFDPARKSYSMKSWAMGRTGDFPVKLLPDGLEWEAPAGPGAVIRHTATIKGDTYHEVGERIAAGREPLRVLEMTLKRLGDTGWPAADPVPHR